VLRDGVATALPSADAAELESGDLLFLAPGQVAPVDLRVLVASEGALVADGGDLARRVYECATEPTAQDLSTSRNMVFASAEVAAGHLCGIVLRDPHGHTQPRAAQGCWAGLTCMFSSD
jgi:magnesium-transporting ATPase (P-type)